MLFTNIGGRQHSCVNLWYVQMRQRGSTAEAMMRYNTSVITLNFIPPQNRSHSGGLVPVTLTSVPFFRPLSVFIFTCSAIINFLFFFILRMGKHENHYDN